MNDRIPLATIISVEVGKDNPLLGGCGADTAIYLYCSIL